jgi:uncharacterized protein HemX
VVALPLLLRPNMPEPEETESHAERRVVYETVSTSSTKSSAITIAVVVVIALAVIVWIVMQMR